METFQIAESLSQYKTATVIVRWEELLSAVPVPDPIFERNKKLLDYDVKSAQTNGDMVEVSLGHYVLK